MGRAQSTLIKVPFQEFPSSPVVRTQHFHFWGSHSIPGPRTKILIAEGMAKSKSFLSDCPLFVLLLLERYSFYVFSVQYGNSEANE